MTTPDTHAPAGPIDANALEAMARERPDEKFLKGSGVLKLTGAIRQLESELRAARAAAPSVPPAAQAIVDAALEWSSEQTVRTWQDAALLHAVATYSGDWPGCDDCDHQCGEDCMPCTAAEWHARIDSRIAELVHEGRLPAPQGYEPPAGWKPIILMRKRSTRSMLADGGLAVAVYLVPTGAVHEGQETFTRHDVKPPLCEAVKLFAFKPLGA